MKKLLFFLQRQLPATGLLLLALASHPAASAQPSTAYDWSWATQLGPSAGFGRTAFLWDVAADAAGNVTIGGEFDPDLYFANNATILQTNRPLEPRTGFTYSNGFLAQYRPDGQLAWTLNLASSGAQVVALATDAAGNIYALGYHNGSFSLGEGGVTVPGVGQRGFLVKLNPAGVAQWAVDLAPAPHGLNEEYFRWRLAVDATGNSVVLGTFDGTISVAGQTYSAPAGSSAYQPFLVRVTASGVVAGSWAGQQTQGSNINRFYSGLALAPTGEVYLAGAVTGGTLQFGGLPPVSSPAPATQPTGFLLKVSAANVAEWLLVGGTSSHNSFDDVKVSANGRIYALGYMDGPLTLGTQAIPNPDGGNAFVVRLTPAGLIRRSATGTSRALRLALGPQDDLYLGSHLDPVGVSWGKVRLPAPAAGQQKVNVVRLDSTGQALQGWQATGPPIFRDLRLAVDGQGRAAVAGWLYGIGTFSFGTSSATATNYSSMLVARTGAPVLAGRAAQPVPGLAIYPNPARQSATLELARATLAKTQVINILGQVVATQELASSRPLNLAGLVAGSYLVRVQQGEAVSYRHLAVLP